MTNRLKAELPDMLSEHRAIVGALERLTQVAKAEGKPEVARFAEKLVLHARTEEEVLYPTSILIGEYVRARLGGHNLRRRVSTELSSGGGQGPGGSGK